MNYIVNKSLLQTAIASLPVTGVITFTCYYNGSYFPINYVLNDSVDSIFTPLDMAIIILSPCGIIVLALLDFFCIFYMKTEKKDKMLDCGVRNQSKLLE